MFYGWTPGSELGLFQLGLPRSAVQRAGEPASTASSNGCWARLGLAQVRYRKGHAQGRRRARAGLNGATTGDLGKFKARGGKFILFQGWADPIVPPYQTIACTRRPSTSSAARRNAKFARLFMVPGRGHCGLGGGLNGFHSANFGAPSLLRPTRTTICSQRSPAGSRTAPLHAKSSRRAMSATTPRRESRCSGRLPLSAKSVVQARRRHEGRQQLRLFGRREIAARAATICRMRATLIIDPHGPHGPFRAFADRAHPYRQRPHGAAELALRARAGGRSSCASTIPISSARAPNTPIRSRSISPGSASCADRVPPPVRPHARSTTRRPRRLRDEGLLYPCLRDRRGARPPSQAPAGARPAADLRSRGACA